jgi:hypothetical protein
VAKCTSNKSKAMKTGQSSNSRHSGVRCSERV